MAGLQKLIGSLPRDPNSVTASFEAFKNGGSGVSTSLSSSDSSRALLTRQPNHRQIISMWTCSKLCVICFDAGVVVGFTLKRRVRRWASKLIKKLRDD